LEKKHICYFEKFFLAQKYSFNQTSHTFLSQQISRETVKYNYFRFAELSKTLTAANVYRLIDNPKGSNQVNES